jgi:hypothetical protein
MNKSIIAAGIAVASAFLTSGMAQALTLPQTLANVHIVELAPRNNGFYITIDGTITACAQTNTVWIGVDPALGTAQYRDLVSTLQLAYALGRPLNLYLATCSGGGTLGYPQAVSADVL